MADIAHITVARFWSKVAVKKSTRECWPWTASKNKDGYGRFKVDGKCHHAHRIAWEIANGESLESRHARHQCDNPACCNPYHIIPGTHADNMADMRSRNRWRAGDMSGIRNPNARLTTDDVEHIRKRITDGDTNRQIATDYAVSEAMISRIKLGKSWSECKEGTNFPNCSPN